MDYKKKQALHHYLNKYITRERAAKIRHVLEYRTRYITFVLENIYQPHNASAVLRSCEINGIQDIHVIENNNTFNPSKNVAMGAGKWLSVYKYNQHENNTIETLNKLKTKGYQIASTTPHHYDYLLQDVPMDQPLALLFGTELTGLSKEAIDHSDIFVKIPMYGFTESYNISVTAALCAYELTQKLRNSRIEWQLSKDDVLDLETEWYKRTIKRSDLLEKEFLKNYSTHN